jgi:hypothetical protein
VTDAEYTGGCLCGHVRYSVHADALFAAYCHCRSCTMASGASYVAWATFPLAAFAFTSGTSSENPSSPPVRRTFCPRCGSALTYTHAERADQIDVTLATLDDAKGLSPQCHVWVSDKRPWVTLADDLPRFSQWPGSPLVS